MEIGEWLGENNQIGIDIWHKKYQRNEESFEEWLKRVSGGNKEVARLVREKKFLFGGRILANRGIDDTEEKTTLSNCYVQPSPEDSIESIYETCRDLAKTYSRGGGCGIDLSKLSPKGARVRNQAQTTSGAVSFMSTFSQVAETIGQHGRRGALMITLSCSHPDIEDFIKSKTDITQINGANISVKISDSFMDAVVNDKDWELYFKREETGEEIKRVVRAKELFNLIVHQGWDYAEPGILFWDRIKSWNLLSEDTNFEYETVNPCGEEPLPAGGSCLLGSFNLSAYVVDKKFDLRSFEQDIKTIVGAMNDVLDEGLPKHPLKIQRESVNKWRQIGIGIMGVGDMLIKLHSRYGSHESQRICDQIGYTMATAAIKASVDLAEKYGAYPAYSEKLLDSDFFYEHTDEETYAKAKKFGLRNSQLLCIAPTGTISTMLGVSGGIEPIYANSYTRLTKSLHGKDVSYKIYTPIVEEYMKENRLTEEEELPAWFITALEINPYTRIGMQGTWQNHIDASISSTINLSEDTTEEDIAKYYINAWENGLKGLTIYRDNCARSGILSTHETTSSIYDSIVPISRKELGQTIGTTYCKKSACGTLYITINSDGNGNIVEIFVNTSKSGICQANTGALSRMISASLRAGLKVSEIIDQLSNIQCPACIKNLEGGTIDGLSCPDIIGSCISDYYSILHSDQEQKVEKKKKEVCPECGGELKYDNGCTTCTECGWSKCNN